MGTQRKPELKPITFEMTVSVDIPDIVVRISLTKEASQRLSDSLAALARHIEYQEGMKKLREG